MGNPRWEYVKAQAVDAGLTSLCEDKFWQIQRLDKRITLSDEETVQITRIDSKDNLLLHLQYMRIGLRDWWNGLYPSYKLLQVQTRGDFLACRSNCTRIPKSLSFYFVLGRVNRVSEKPLATGSLSRCLLGMPS